mgnify:CR=1 FL=1
MGRKDNSVFSFFKRKKRKLTPKERNELALERARAISDKMVKDKEDSRNLFLEKILENAKAYNAAKEDFVSEEENKEDK